MRYSNVVLTILLVLVSASAGQQRRPRGGVGSGRPGTSRTWRVGSPRSEMPPEIRARAEKARAEQRAREADQIALDVRAVDPQGKAVGATLYGTHVLYNSDTLDESPYRMASDASVDILKIRDGEVRGSSGISGSYGDGSTAVTMSRSRGRALLYVVNVERQLAALQEITSTDAAGPITVKLSPACRVSGVVTSSQLRRLGRGLRHLQVKVHRGQEQPITWRDPVELPKIYDPHKSSLRRDRYRFELYLPVGQYRLEISAGDETRTRNFNLRVDPGRGSMDVGSIEMPITPLIAMQGKAAPALPSARWLGGEAVTLADLKGPPAVVYFTDEFEIPDPRAGAVGTSRPSLLRPAVGPMSSAGGGGGAAAGAVYTDDRNLKLIGQDFGHLGLEVIAFAQKAGNATQMPGVRAALLMGAKAGDWPVEAYPSTVIIDADGKIAAALTGAPNVEDIEKALQTKASWRERFESMYLLGPDESVKVVANAPATLRQSYWHSRPYTIAASGLPGKAVYAYEDDGLVLKSDWRGFASIPGDILDGVQVRYDPDMLRFALRSKVGGDWVYRADATRDDRLKSLTPLLQRQIGPGVSVMMQSLADDTISVSGVFRCCGLADGGETVHLFAGSPTGGSPTKTAGLDELLMDLSRYIDQTILFEHQEDSIPQVRYRLDGSLGAIKAQTDPAKRSAMLAEVLKSLDKQASLRVDYSVDPEDVVLLSSMAMKRQMYGPTGAPPGGNQGRPMQEE